MSQSPGHRQPMGSEEGPVVQEMRFWLEKVTGWAQDDGPDARKDARLHLGRLRGFLQRLLAHISSMSSTTETMRRLPCVGQLVGRLCWNPFVIADDASRASIFQCLWGLHSEQPSNAVERKANQWIQKVLCQLATGGGDDDDDAAAAQTLARHMDAAPTPYHLRVLRKTVSLLREKVGKSCGLPGDVNQRCSCDSVLATSQACVPLVTHPEVAPLIGALLLRPATCARATLSADFLEALSSAYSRHGVSLEEQAVISLWYHSLSSLEEAALGLLESALANRGSPPLEQQVARSLLPKACAQHCSMFLVVSDIFRSVLKRAEENEGVRTLIQTFTSCFFRELMLLQPQTSVSLRAFFPQSPPSLLLPLLTPPSETPQEAWRHHLNWLSGSLQRLTEEEEEQEEEEDGDEGGRGLHRVFEAWFLLVQCSHWVQVAGQLLAEAEPEHCGPLLWLLTFYHHPTNRGHRRDLQLVLAQQARGHLHALFSVVAAPPPPAERLQALAALLTPPPPPLILALLVNSAVFSQQPLGESAEILRTLVDRSGLAGEAAHVLSSLELRLGAGSGLSGDGGGVHLRIKALRNTLAHADTVTGAVH